MSNTSKPSALITNVSRKSRIISLLLIAIVLGGLLIPFKFGRSQLLWDRLSDAFHFPLFLLIAFGVSLALRKRLKLSWQVNFLSLVITVTFAIAIEIIQPLFGRSASWVDVRNGVVGAFFGACVLQLTSNFRTRGMAVWLLGVTAMSVFLGLGIYQAWAIVDWQSKAFPNLSDFSDERQLLLWRGYGGDQKKTEVKIEQINSNPTLEVISGTGEWVGVEFKVNGLNWINYESLSFSIHNPNEQFVLGLRVDDNHRCKEPRDRFNTTVPIKPGVNLISIPVEAIAAGPEMRRLNLKQISRVLFFIKSADKPHKFFIDDVHLK